MHPLFLFLEWMKINSSVSAAGLRFVTHTVKKSHSVWETSHRVFRRDRLTDTDVGDLSLGMGWRKKLKKAKKLHRPDLKDWECDELYRDFPSWSDEIVAKKREPQTFSLKGQTVPPTLPHVLDSRVLTLGEFHKYETAGTPCVIKGIPDGFDASERVGQWPALNRWSLEDLDKDEELRNRVFKCGEDDNGSSIKIKLKHFLKYVHSNRDDSPLYVFDSSFDEDRLAKRILTDYRVPSYFSDDLFRLVSESRRPPYRWFLVGPERSGTTVHIDPLATSAWNTLLFGKKRWVLFPPHVPKKIVKGKGLIYRDEDDEAIHYFMDILPRIKRKAESLKHLPEYQEFACYEFTQNAGETCFIPNGWWHAVINLTHTVGVTQNFCSERNFDQVWVATRSGRKRMAWKWLNELEKSYPHLAERARELNEQDKWVMKYDPVEVQKRKDESHRKKKRKSHNEV